MGSWDERSVPSRLTCVPYGMNVCVNTNTVTLFSQVVHNLLQNPYREKNVGVFFPDILEKKFDFACYAKRSIASNSLNISTLKENVM